MLMIEKRRERRRGCGYRQPGGLYLVAEALARACGKFPLLVHTCPTCGAGIKPARGWTWVDGTALFAAQPCRNAAVPSNYYGTVEQGCYCDACPIGAGERRRLPIAA